jgi:Salmonella virulence plasmid 65kDa B protein
MSPRAQVRRKLVFPSKYQDSGVWSRTSRSSNHSGGGNGIVGVGWSLGFPTIERQGADGGSPQYDSWDSYNLGGQDLHSCGASSSPGCLAGGTHFTEHENYERITYDSGSDQ